MQPPCLCQLAQMLRQQQAPCHASTATALLQVLGKHRHELAHAAATACLLGLSSTASITAPHDGCLQKCAQACRRASTSQSGSPCHAKCSHPCCRNVAKHGRELARMQHPRHRELVRVVEAALAVMRLSCERYFVLLSVLATYLLFRDRVPRVARQLIRLNHQLCRLFQRVSAQGLMEP